MKLVEALEILEESDRRTIQSFTQISKRVQQVERELKKRAAADPVKAPFIKAMLPTVSDAIHQLDQLGTDLAVIERFMKDKKINI